jgi:hypothetical protein
VILRIGENLSFGNGTFARHGLIGFRLSVFGLGQTRIRS